MLLVLLIGCVPQVRPCPPIVAEDFVDDAARSTACDRAGENMARLRCSISLPNFGAYCRNRMSAGIPMRPVCLAKITKCDDVESCSPGAK